MMFKGKRTLIMAASIVLSLCLTVFGTLAYLSDSHTVVNTFTVGNVDITVNETEVDPNGEPTGNEERVETNEYHLMPGHTYTKDPTMTVHPGSEHSYVRMVVTLNKLEELKAIACLGGEDFTIENIISGWDSELWSLHATTEDEASNTVTYEFRYHETVDASELEEDLVLEPLFTEISMPGEITGEELATIADLELTIHGHAIQVLGFDDADEAWTAFDAQVGTGSEPEGGNEPAGGNGGE